MEPEIKRAFFPPHALLLGVLAAVGLCFLSRVRILPSSEASALIGLPLSIFGVCLVLSCAYRFKKAETGLRPFTESTQVLTSGPYQISRNPIYLGMVLILLGVAFSLNKLLPFLVPVLFFVWVHFRFVLPEERMMEEVHGEEFLSYRAKVRRWF